MFEVGCGFFGCNRRPLRNETVDIVVDGQALTVTPCGYHQDIIINGDSTKYHIGFAYTGEPEIRLHALPQPATPPA